MTDKEKRELLDNLIEGSWDALKNLHRFGDDKPHAMRSLLYSIEIMREMRIDYEDREEEEK